MLKRLLIVSWLAFCCLSCAVPAIQGIPGQPPFAADLEPYEEAVDRGCAYFNFLWGKSAELDGHFDEAIYAYKQALVCDRRAGHIIRSLAPLLIKAGQREQAVGLANRLIALDPKDVEARMFLANIYIKMERFAEAQEIYQAILADDPKNFNVRMQLSGLYARLHDYEKARQELEKLVESNQDSYAGFYYLAKLYQEMHLFDKATEAMAKALTLNWSPTLAYEAAALYEEGKRYPEAIAIYRRIIKEDGAEERARGLLASIYFLQGDVNAALKEMDNLRDVSANPVKVELAISRILFDTGRDLEAVARLNAILKKDPQVDEARTLLILHYYQQGDLASAKRLLKQVRYSSPAYEDSILLLVRVMQKEKDFFEAEKTLQQAIADGQSRRLSFYVALANLYADQHKADKARGVFVKAFADFPGKVQTFYEYALLLHKLNDEVGAMRQMEEVLRLEPKHALALNFIGYTWAEEGRNLKEAKVYIEQAVALLPKEGFIRDSMGWVYYQLGDFVAAIRELELAVTLSSDDPTIYEHLGDAYLKNNDKQKARMAYVKSLESYEEAEKKAVIRRKLEALSSEVNQAGGAK